MIITIHIPLQNLTLGKIPCTTKTLFAVRRWYISGVRNNCRDALNQVLYENIECLMYRLMSLDDRLFSRSRKSWKFDIIFVYELNDFRSIPTCCHYNYEYNEIILIYLKHIRKTFDLF